MSIVQRLRPVCGASPASSYQRHIKWYHLLPGARQWRRRTDFSSHTLVTMEVITSEVSRLKINIKHKKKTCFYIDLEVNLFKNMKTIFFLGCELIWVALCLIVCVFWNTVSVSLESVIEEFLIQFLFFKFKVKLFFGQLWVPMRHRSFVNNAHMQLIRRLFQISEMYHLWLLTFSYSFSVNPTRYVFKLRTSHWFTFYGNNFQFHKRFWLYCPKHCA